jgi:hypothetical protein
MNRSSRKEHAMTRKPSARQEAQGRPCVVIEFCKDGGFFVHGDPEVQIFNRHEDPDIDGLYRYQNIPIPEGWLDEPAIDLDEEQFA